jgi:hypothetical protein
MKQTYSPEAKFIIYLGVNKLKDNETWQMLSRFPGLSFEKGYVYKVTPEVAEYLKPLREFMIVKGVKEGISSFKKG